MKEVTKDKLFYYFNITKKALDMAGKAMDGSRREEAQDFFDMAKRYYDDAHFFAKKGEYVTAFAAINYAHGWLDAGARIKLFKVKDSKLFTVDDE